MSPAAEQSVGQRALRGMLWAYGSYFGQRLLVLVFTGVLARLLAPEQFGLVALAMVFISLLETISDAGLNQALVIVSGHEVEERAHTVFRWSVLIGVALTIATALIAVPASGFFDEPALVEILPVLGLTLLLRASSSTHYALAQKSIDFRSRTIAEIADVATRGITGVTLALLGFGAWSLVLGYVAGSAALGIALWLLVPWRPRLGGQHTPVGEMLRFGGTLTLVNLVAAVIANVDYLVVGRVLGSTSLGLYTLAFKLPEMLILNLSVVAGRVLFPAFTDADDHTLALRFLRSLRFTLMVGLPLAAAVAILARPLVQVTFGEEWLPSVPSMRVLSVYALAVTVGIPAGTVFKAVGRADVLLKLALPRLALLTVALVVVAHRGIEAVAGAQGVVAAMFSLFSTALIGRHLPVRARDVWEASWPAVAATAGLAAAAIAVSQLDLHPLALLALAGATGGVCYVGLLLLLARDSILELWALAGIGGRPAEETAGAG